MNLKMPKVFPRVPSNTKLSAEVPLLFQEPDIIHGYRDNYQTLSYYTSSIFWLHNESLNVWTHLLAAFLLAQKGWDLCSSLDVHSDPYAQVFAVYCFGCCVYPLASALAHLFQSKDELTHHLCFYLDYAAVSIYGNGTALACYHLASQPDFFSAWQGWFMAVNTFLSIMMCLCCGYAKYRYERPYPRRRKYWQMVSAGLGHLQMTSPVYHMLGFQLFYKSSLGLDFYYHLLQCLLFIPGALFFAVPYPQRLKLGYFDLIGHSHQLFHVFMSMMTYYQMKALYLNLLQNREVYTGLYTLSFANTFGYIAVVISVDALIVWGLWYKTKQKLERMKTA